MISSDLNFLKFEYGSLGPSLASELAILMLCLIFEYNYWSKVKTNSDN